MKNITRNFITSVYRVKKSKIEQSRIIQQLEKEYNTAKKNGDKIAELALQRAYFSYLAK